MICAFPRLLAAACGLAAAAFAGTTLATEVARAPASPWVEELPIPDVDPEVERQTADGTCNLLVDRQRDEAGQISFDHYARKFTSASGVQEGARIEVAFAPTYQKLTFHKLVLHRDGRILDRLPTAHIRLLDREDDLRNNIYSGFVTATIDVEDVRIGDTLEYSFSVQGENPVFGGVFGEFVATTWSTPVARFGFRLRWPKDRYLGIKTIGPAPEPTVTELPDAVEYHWSARNVPAAQAEGDTPSWYSPFGMIQLSGYRDWAEVVNWALAFYALDDPLPPEIHAEVERLRQLEWEEDRILGALEYVQNNVRYLSISEGVHSHRPYPIADVVSRGYGDCKDKARLLCVMLRALGFVADPALVHTDYRQEIGQWLPSPLDFDHVIVGLRRDGRRYWLDATRDHQRGSLADRYSPAYGKALIIQPGETALSDVAPAGAGIAAISVENSVQLPPKDAPAELAIKTTVFGREADRQRYIRASTSAAQIAKDYLNFFTRQFPGAESRAAPVFQDDPAKNRVTIEEAYRVPHFWQAGPGNPNRLQAEVYPYEIDAEVGLPRTQNRTTPLAVGYPKNIRESFVLHLPVDGNFPNENVTVDDPAFRFDSAVRYENRVLTIVYEYQALAAFVPPERVAAYLTNVRKVRVALGYSITVPKDILTGTSPVAAFAAAPNWTLILIVILFAIIATAVAVVAYLWRPTWPPRPAHPKYNGLKGWLLVVGFGLIGRPIFAVIALYGLGDLFNFQHWSQFTSPGNLYYHPLWAPVFIFELFVLIGALIASVLLLALFFQRRRTFPPLFVCVLGAVTVCVVLDFLFASHLAEKFPQLKLDTTPKEAVQACVQAAIWIPYMLISQRVRATFVK